MDNLLPISYLNDFIFCPVSIYFHQLYGEQTKITYQCSDQINGRAAHAAVDTGHYSTKKSILQALAVYSEKYGIVGKIDVFDTEKGILTERKKKIKQIFDGYIFQIYAQYYCLKEMGYDVKMLRLYSMDDNKVYPIPFPDDNLEMKNKFERLLINIREFDFETFHQKNSKKCAHCIYEPACDRTLL